MSQATSAPVASARVGTTLLSTAVTELGIQPARSGMCSACMPRSLRTPDAPLVSALRFQLMALCGSRSLECRNADRTAMTRPKRRSSIHLAMRWAPGKNGSSDEQRTSSSGCSSIAAVMARLAARSMPKGFSPRR